MEIKQYFFSLRMVSNDIDIALNKLLINFNLVKRSPSSLLPQKYPAMLAKMSEGYVKALYTHQEPIEFYRWLFRMLGSLGIDYDNQYLTDSETSLGKYIADELLLEVDKEIIPKLNAIGADVNNPHLRWTISINGDSVQLIERGDVRIEEYERLKTELAFYKQCYDIVTSKAPWLLPEYSDIEQLDYGNLYKQMAVNEPAWLTSLTSKSTK